MWVPGPQAILFRLSDHVRGFHVESLGGKDFCWEQEGQTIVRCWLTRQEDEWLRTKILGTLPKGKRTHMTNVYESLQSEMCRYIGKARQYELGRLLSDNPPLDTIASAVDGGAIVNRNNSVVAEAVYLLETEKRLRSDLEAFLRDLVLTL